MIVDNQIEEDSNIKESKSINEQPNKNNGIEIDIIGPLTFWLSFLVMGVIIQLILIPIFNNSIDNSIIEVLNKISGWILYLPGSLILSLIVALWIGERIGATKNKVKSAVIIGVINAVYTIIVYIIAIFIIYLLISYIEPTFIKDYNLTLTLLAEYVIIIPSAIVLILVPFIASLSAARHKNIE
ncbi:MAG: hypothetical protein ACP5LH_01325 [Candidatus Micrarchaeia archaeon]